MTLTHGNPSIVGRERGELKLFPWGIYQKNGSQRLKRKEAKLVRLTTTQQSRHLSPGVIMVMTTGQREVRSVNLQTWDLGSAQEVKKLVSCSEIKPEVSFSEYILRQDCNSVGVIGEVGGPILEGGGVPSQEIGTRIKRK